LKKAGCDGVQLSFFDFAPDLEFFGERVLPLLCDAGLRLRPSPTSAPER
jgi:FMNH2-dependent dimethyl sulfone monooxygenase